MNSNISSNYARLKLTLFILPLFLLFIIIVFLYGNNALSVDQYAQIQKNSFFFINHHLGQYPSTEYNLTQLGDALIFLSILSVFIVSASELWKALISASLISLVITSLLKPLFAVPRPAVVFDKNQFIIIGKTLSGHNSLPSGHSITIFTILTVLMFAFMPTNRRYKLLWFFAILTIGLIFAFTRVGVGAHYPLDVISGCITGYISGITGIFINRKYPFWDWIDHKKYYPFFIILFITCSIVLISKINHENLMIFYFSLIGLIISLYKMIITYVKK